MPLAPILNQAEHRWYEFDIRTMCLNIVRVVVAMSTTTISLFSGMSTNTVAINPAAALGNADVVEAIGTDIDAGACQE